MINQTIPPGNHKEAIAVYMNISTTIKIRTYKKSYL